MNPPSPSNTVQFVQPTKASGGPSYDEREARYKSWKNFQIFSKFRDDFFRETVSSLCLFAAKGSATFYHLHLKHLQMDSERLYLLLGPTLDHRGLLRTTSGRICMSNVQV